MKALKTLFVVFVTFSLAAASVLAQGRINFANSSATPLRIYSTSVNGGVPVVLGTASTALFGFGPASVQITLYAGLTSSSLSPVLIGTAADVPFVLNTASTIASIQGTFNGGSIASPFGSLPLAGYDGSAPVFLQFTAYPTNGFFFPAQSPIIQVTLATGVATATSVFSPTADASHWAGLIIGDIPEPSAMALVSLSFSLMFIARHRR